jgi:hypothetical protein
MLDRRLSLQCTILTLLLPTSTAWLLWSVLDGLIDAAYFLLVPVKRRTFLLPCNQLDLPILFEEVEVRCKTGQQI